MQNLKVLHLVRYFLYTLLPIRCYTIRIDKIFKRLIKD